MIERIQDDLDLQDEDFISTDEITRHINAGIRRAEALILTLYEDYLLAPAATITLVNGTSQYSLPTGIYANKIRRVLYNNGTKKRIITRVKRLEDTILLTGSEDYQYLITNDTSSGVKINIYPTPAESGAYVSVFYIRQVNELSALTDTLELGEIEDFVIQYAKDKCVNKERMTPDAPPSAALKEEEALLIDTLANRVPDEDNTIEPDLTFYGEHV
jgi:hypothetical protein